MVQVDLPAAFTVGQVFALLAKDYLKKEPDKFTNKLLGPLNFYLSCGFATIGMYLLVGWPYWEVMSTTAWVESPSNRPFVAGFYILFMFLIVFLGNVGFILGHHWYLMKKDILVVYGAIVGGVLTVLPFLLRWGVWWKVGPYVKTGEVAFFGKMIDVYAFAETGEVYSFWKPPFFYGWLFVMCYFVLATAIAGYWFKKKGSKLS